MILTDGQGNFMKSRLITHKIGFYPSERLKIQTFKIIQFFFLKILTLDYAPSSLFLDL